MIHRACPDSKKKHIRNFTGYKQNSFVFLSPSPEDFDAVLGVVLYVSVDELHWRWVDWLPNQQPLLLAHAIRQVGQPCIG